MIACASLVAAGAACNALFGVDELTYHEQGSTTTTGGGGTATGGDCSDGDERSCYSGPATTEDVGACRAGVERCAGGSWTGICEGEVLPQLESCSTTEDDDCDGAFCGELLFATTIGLAGDQTIEDVLVSADGRAVVAGSFTGELGLDPNAGSTQSPDGFLAVIDDDGTSAVVVIAKGYAASVQDVALGPDGDLFVVGSFGGGSLALVDQVLVGMGGMDSFVARITTSGQVVWSTIIAGGGNDLVRAVDYDPSGGLYVGGNYSSGSLMLGGVDLGLPSPAGSDAFVVRVDGENGGAIWARAYGWGDPDITHGIAVRPSGRVTLALEVSTPTDLGLPYQGGRDAAVVNLDADGNVLWARAFGSIGNDDFRAVADVPGDRVVLAGTIGGSTTFDDTTVTASTTSGVVVTLDEATGALIWVTPLLGPGIERVTSVDSDDLGRTFIGGFYDASLDLDGGSLPDAAGKRSPFVARLGVAGDVDYAFGWPADATFTNTSTLPGLVAVDADAGGGLLVGGSFVTDIDFGGRYGVVPATQATDAFLLRLAP